MMVKTRPVLTIGIGIAIWAITPVRTAHAGWVLSCDSPSLSQLLLGEDLRASHAGSSMACPSWPERADQVPTPPGPQPPDVLLIGMHAVPAAGMSGTSSVVSGSSPGHSQPAVAGPFLDFADPPLPDRIFDQPHLILPTAPIFELLRPA